MKLAMWFLLRTAAPVKQSWGLYVDTSLQPLSPLGFYSPQSAGLAFCMSSTPGVMTTLSSLTHIPPLFPSLVSFVVSCLVFCDYNPQGENYNFLVSPKTFRLVLRELYLLVSPCHWPCATMWPCGSMWYLPMFPPLWLIPVYPSVAILFGFFIGSYYLPPF